MAEPGPRQWYDDTKRALRLRRYSPRTEDAYLGWLRRYLAFRQRLPPGVEGAESVRRFVEALERRGVSGGTQKQALAAVRFAYDRGAGYPLPWVEGLMPIHRPPRLPVVLSPGEVGAVLSHLRGAKRLVVLLLYGSGLRLLEALHLRVKDLDFERCTLVVRSGKATRTAARYSLARCTRTCARTLAG